MAIFKKKVPTPGRDKMDLSKSVKLGGKVVEENAHEKEYGRKARARVAMFVLMFSVVFAFIYSEFYVDSKRALNVLADKNLNKLFFGPGYARLIGDKDIDQGLNIFIRGIFFMGVFGLSPYITYLFAKFSDSRGGSFYYKNWAAIAFVVFAVALVQALLWPLLSGVIELFTLETR